MTAGSNYEATRRSYQDPQAVLRQDGQRKDGDDEFAFFKDPPDLQPFQVYREIAALATDEAATDVTDLEFGPELDVAMYRTIAVAWSIVAGDVTETGILVPQAKLLGMGGTESELTTWYPPAVVDSTLATGVRPSYDYREVAPAEFRLVFQRPSGELFGDTGVGVILNFDVTHYEKFRLGVGVVTGGQDLAHGLFTSLTR